MLGHLLRGGRVEVGQHNYRVVAFHLQRGIEAGHREAAGEVAVLTADAACMTNALGGQQ